MGTPIQDLNQLVRDCTIYPLSGSGGGGGVPTTRQLLATAPFITVNGGPSANLAADVTIAIVQTGGGTGLVGNGRLITGTSPIRIGGGLNQTLAADIVISALPFSGTIDGIVAHNPSGVQGKYLKDDNTWGTSTAAGVTSVTGTTPITVSPVIGVGDLTISVLQAGIAQAGIVPATGGVDASKFLCATNPLSWQTPGTGIFVRLQAATPGALDTGHFRISGTGIIGTHAIIGGEAPSLGPAVTATTAGAHIRQFGTFAAAEFSAVSNDALPVNIVLQKNRFSSSAVQPGSSGDQLASLLTSVRNAANNADVLRPFLQVYQDGAADGQGGLHATRLLAGEAISDLMMMWLTRDGAYVGRNVLTKPTAASRFHIAGSLSIAKTIKTTTDFTAGLEDCAFLVDSSARGGTLVANLPVANTCVGRIYSFTKIDNSALPINVLPNGADTVGTSNGTLFLRSQYDSCVIMSDGASGWWILSSGLAPCNGNLSDGAALANSVTETAIWQTPQLGTGVGSVWRTRVAGKFSTTGTPTLRFRLKNSTVGATLADSGLITMPAGLTDAVWQIDAEFVERDTAFPVGFRTSRAILSIAQAAGVGAAMNQYNMDDITIVTASGGCAGVALSAQWGTANPSNSITAIQGDCERQLGALT